MGFITMKLTTLWDNMFGSRFPSIEREQIPGKYCSRNKPQLLSECRDFCFGEMPMGMNRDFFVAGRGGGGCVLIRDVKAQATFCRRPPPLRKKNGLRHKQKKAKR